MYVKLKLNWTVAPSRSVAIKACELSDASLGILVPAYYDSKLWLARVHCT